MIILLAVFCLSFAVNKYLLREKYGLSLIGRISMAAVLIAAGISHFTNTEIMIRMMPEAIPAKREIVYFTGICELLAVIGLIWGRFSRFTSIVLIIFFIAILPANVAGSFKKVDLGGMAYGPAYLLFRIPLQILFILWTYYFGIQILKREK